MKPSPSPPVASEDLALAGASAAAVGAAAAGAAEAAAGEAAEADAGLRSTLLQGSREDAVADESADEVASGTLGVSVLPITGRAAAGPLTLGAELAAGSEAAGADLVDPSAAAWPGGGEALARAVAAGDWAGGGTPADSEALDDGSSSNSVTCEHMHCPLAGKHNGPAHEAHRRKFDCLRCRRSVAHPVERI